MLGGCIFESQHPSSFARHGEQAGGPLYTKEQGYRAHDFRSQARLLVSYVVSSTERYTSLHQILNIYLCNYFLLIVRSAIPVRVLAPKLPPTSEYAGPQAGPN